MASKHDVLNLYYKRILFDCSSGPNKKIRISHIFEIRQKTGIGGISWFQPYLNKLFFLYVRSSASAVIRKNIGKKTKQGKLILNLKKDYVWNSNGNAYLLLQLEDWCTHFFFFLCYLDCNPINLSTLNYTEWCPTERPRFTTVSSWNARTRHSWCY